MFEKYIPGYKPQQSEESDYGYPRKTDKSTKEVTAEIIHPFNEEVSKVN